MPTQFMSVENMKSLLLSVNALMKQRYSIDIDDPKVKHVVFKAMESVQDDSECSELSFADKNNLVVNSLKSYYKRLAAEPRALHRPAMSAQTMLYPQVTQATDAQQPDPVSRITDLNPNHSQQPAYVPPRMTPVVVQPTPEPQGVQVVHRSDIVAGPSEYKRHGFATKYFNVDGFDRDVAMYPKRFSFAINIARHQTYRNVASVAVTSVILPLQALNLANDQAFYVTDSFNLSTPYLILRINELEGVCDGTNDVMSRSFCKLVVVHRVVGHSGRTFVHMKPCQDERLVLRTPMATMPSTLTISLMKPNGSPFSSTGDTDQIARIVVATDHEANWVISTVDYFPTNAYVKGDIIRIRDFVSGAGEILDRFICRDEGHDVLNVSDLTATGYFRGIIIKRPGDFDASTGVWVTPKAMMDEFDTYTKAGGTAVSPGSIMNMSIQLSVSMTVTTAVALLDTDVHESPL